MAGNQSDSVDLNEHESSLQQFLSKFEEINYIYIVSTVCLLGVFLNAACVLVFNRLRKEAEVNSSKSAFTLLMAVCLVDCVYLSLGIPLFVAEVNTIPIANTFAAILFTWLSEYFITSTLALFNILIEWIIMLRRYFSLCGYSVKCRISNKMIIGIVYSLAFVAYTPILFAFRIEVDSKKVCPKCYVLTRTEFGQSIYFKVITIAISSLRGVGTIVFMIVVSFLTHRKHSQLSKLAARPPAQLGTDLTRMVLSMCCLIVVGSTPYSIYNVLTLFVSSSEVRVQIYFGFTLLVLMCYHSIRFFVYLTFNPLFRRAIRLKSKRKPARTVES
nr:G protein-coupled receptor [Proales similis]